MERQPRTLQPGQRSQLFTHDLPTGASTLVAKSTSVLFEAPNWTVDGDWLIVNGDGLLQRVPAAGGELEPIVVPGLPLLNDDHVLSPDGTAAYVSGFDGHLHHVSTPSGAKTWRAIRSCSGCGWTAPASSNSPTTSG